MASRGGAGLKLEDVQGERDDRRVDITKVGVKGLHYPISVLDRQNGFQHTIATFNMYVNLPHKQRGTHMSRFIEILNRFRGEINLRSIPTILDTMMERLKAQSAHLEVEFPYFLEKAAPVSGSKSMVSYTYRFLGLAASKPAPRKGGGRKRPPRARRKIFRWR